MADLASILTEHGLTYMSDGEASGFICLCERRDLNPTRMSQDSWAAHVAGVVRDTRTIVTIKRLDALPTGTLVIDADGEFLYRWPDGEADWERPGDEAAYPHESVARPARVLWHPEWDGSDD